MARRPSLELDHLSTLDRVSTFPIRTFGDPVLKSPASEVTEIDDALRRLVDGMVQTMYEAPGVGLAAPQVGVQKRLFVYDVWGNAVNTAARMESYGVAGRVQVSERTRRLLAEPFLLEERGILEVEGKGELKTWFLAGRN